MAAALETQEDHPHGMTGDPRRLRTDLMCAHDGSLAQDEHGAFLSPSGVIEQTLRLSSPYHDEIDPEAFAERCKALADRYPDLTGSAHLFQTIAEGTH